MNYPTTKLIYLTDMFKYTDQAKIIDITTENINNQKIIAIILDQTIFFPKSSSQPSDIGFIEANESTFRVQKVSFKDGVIYHYGNFIDEQRNLCADVIVNLVVDKQKRKLHSKWHTAGHIIDFALESLKINLQPVKASYTPQLAFVEYAGTLDKEVKEHLQEKLQKEINRILSLGKNIFTKLCDFKNLNESCKNISEDISEDHPMRVMVLEGFGEVPCTGTHVANVQEIKNITITKVKSKKSSIKISYNTK